MGEKWAFSKTSRVQNVFYSITFLFMLRIISEKFQQLQVRHRPHQVPYPTFHLKLKPLATTRHSEPDERDKNPYEDKDAEENDNQNDDEDEEDKTSYTGSMTPQYSHCTRGVSTDDTELTQNTTQLSST